MARTQSTDVFYTWNSALIRLILEFCQYLLGGGGGAMSGLTFLRREKMLPGKGICQLKTENRIDFSYAVPGLPRN